MNTLKSFHNIIYRVLPFVLTIVFVLSTFAYLFIPKSASASNYDDFFRLSLSPATSTTSSKITIRVSHRWGQNYEWRCLPDADDTNWAFVWANNTKATKVAADYYELPHTAWACRSGVSEITWDLAAHGGNTLHGLKTINFRLEDGNQSGDGWYVSRTISYVAPPKKVIEEPTSTGTASTTTSNQSTENSTAKTSPEKDVVSTENTGAEAVTDQNVATNEESQPLSSENAISRVAGWFGGNLFLPFITGFLFLLVLALVLDKVGLIKFQVPLLEGRGKKKGK
jgi:hypothetical protein